MYFPSNTRISYRLMVNVLCVEPLSTHAVAMIILASGDICGSLIGIIVFMVSILWHVIARHRMFRPGGAS